MDRQFVTETLEAYLLPLLTPKQSTEPSARQMPAEGDQGDASSPSVKSAPVSSVSTEPVLPVMKTDTEPMQQPTHAATQTTTDLADAGAKAHEQHKQRLEKMLAQVTASPVAATVIATKTTADSSLGEGVADISRTREKNSGPDTVDQDDLQQATMDPTQQSSEAYRPIPSQWLDNGQPRWAQERFDILLIEVNGLKLAVPLIALGQIQPLEALTPLFGQSTWFMGLQKTPIGNIKTVDTAKFVMPEHYQQGADYRFVVSINGLDWGLAVDAIDQPIDIHPSEIRWRKNRSSRPWMAGTVKDHMCVLVDIPTMGELLQSHDQNQH